MEFKCGRDYYVAIAQALEDTAIEQSMKWLVLLENYVDINYIDENNLKDLIVEHAVKSFHNASLYITTVNIIADTDKFINKQNTEYLARVPVSSNLIN